MDYYLIDSLNLDELSKEDKAVIDSCLKVYHSSKIDTSKLRAINVLMDNCSDDKVWPLYNQWLLKEVNKKLKSKLSNKEMFFYMQFKAGCTGMLGFVENDPIQALEKYDEALEICASIKDTEGLAFFNESVGIEFENIGEVDTAFYHYSMSLAYWEAIGNDDGIATLSNKIGQIYKQYGNYGKALEYFYDALKSYEKTESKEDIATCCNYLAGVFDEQADYEKAISLYERGIKLSEEIGDVNGVSTLTMNMAYTYKLKGDLKTAKRLYLKTIEIKEEIEDDMGVAFGNIHLGALYRDLGEYDKAMESYEVCYRMFQEMQYAPGVAGSTKHLASLFLLKGELTRAHDYAQESMALSKDMGYTLYIRNAADVLSQIYEKQGKYKQALEMYQLFIQLKDSINNEETQKATAKQQAKYEYEKQKAIDDASHDKQLAIEQEEKEKQQILTYATTGGLGLLGIFLIVVFNRLKITRKQKYVIEEQKLEVEAQKEVVEEAHSELEEKNKEITDSIQYAKRIQSAILPPKKLVKEYLQDSFVLYKPKDIVAGDFYWLEHKNGKILFAVADCTGHGVPGAMVSVVCNNGLNRSVREHGLTDPGQILDKTREIVIAEFEKSEEEVKDGMDIALCSLEGSTLKYAGAHNPLWVIRNGELLETKANKQPIGKFENPDLYDTHTFELEKGDSVYLFSDGYADQFGGEKGKKLKTANFKKLLLSIQDQEMHQQRESIDKAFEDWKGDLEQLDDVCVIGVRF